MTGDADRLARAAARRLAEGLDSTIDGALNAAVRALRIDAAPVNHASVRRHWQGLMMQSCGAEGYEAYRRRVWSVAEELLSSLETVTDDAPVFLVGRAAQQLIDGPVTLHTRVYTDIPLGRLAEALADQGYAEPTFTTFETRLGRLDAMEFGEDEFDISIVRCAPAMLGDADRNLFSNDRIARATPAQVRAWARAGC